ncbi:MAG TPA: Ig-like domain-containing protein [Thermoguttaceae bacterium]|nr:Ig-like domain-containing protein [Thermoguttaceae bacterium]
MRPSLLNSRRGSLSRKRRRAGRSRRRLGTASLRLEPLEQRTLLSLNPAMLADIQDGTMSSSPSDFVEVGETTFFVAYHGFHGTELWKTDGTVSGTMIVKDIFPGSEPYYGSANGHSYDGYRYFSSSPQDLTNVNGKLYFTADDGEHGRELWKSDGTEDGTVMVKDIDDDFTYDQSSQTDVPNASDPQELTAVGGTLYFTADDGVGGRELWKSNGTPGGTVMVKDIDDGSTGSVPNSSDPQELTAVGGTLYFTADDGDHGRELWKSSGTAGGTVMVEDIDDGSTASVPNASDPQHLTAVGATLYFTADDGASGRELWKSGSAGTVMVEDIDDDSTDGVPNSSDPQKLTNVGGTLYFTAYDEDHGRELWKSDGTQGGTALVKDIITGTSTDPTYGEFPNSSSPDGLTNVNGTLFFSAYGEDEDGEDHGRELWKSNGTPDGTVLVKDVFPGDYLYASQGYFPNSSNPQGLTSVDGALYFTADDGTRGRELWKSNGTPGGTELVEDVYSGSTDGAPNASDPQSLTYANGRLYFSAADGTHGRELWVLPVTSEAIEAEAHLSIFINGQPTAIPINVGVDSQGNISTIYTVDANGTLKISPVGDVPILDPVTLGHFFDTWKNNAGLANPNPNAVFNEGQILTHTTDAGHMIQVFVNGQANRQFEEYGIRDGDEIAIVYTSNEVVSLNTNVGSILIELYEDETPLTFDNFLKYVNGGDYVNTFFHRSANLTSGQNRVIQTGGFTTPTLTFTSLQDFDEVESRGYLQHEGGISNLRATIAMARLGVSPTPGVDAEDSATSQFYINVDDNAILDPDRDPDPAKDKPGYTVFGRVLGMSVADAIAGLTNQDLDGNQGTLYDDTPFTASSELVVIQSIGGEGDLSGTSFKDKDFDGAQDDGELGLAGATVFVDANDNGVLDGGEYSTVTDSQGDWELRLPAGTYVIRQQPKSALYPKTSDGTGSHTVTVQIGGGIDELDFANVNNAPPVATADAYDVDEDMPLSKSAVAGVLSNDTDEEGDDLTAVLVETVQHGTLSLAANGSFTYTPAANFNGIDSFTYRAQDQYSQSSIATVEITVNPVDDAPIAVNDAFTLPEGAQAHELDVMGNDNEPDGQALTITVVTPGSQGGTVAITTGGATVSYTPLAGFSGTEKFTYTIEDPDGLTDQAEVTVTVDDDANQTPGSISGFVYWDCDNDGQRDGGEFGIYGTLVKLTGKDDENNSVSKSLLTKADGSYSFDGLAPGTYEVAEQQPAALVDGKETIGTSGGTVGADKFSAIVLSANEHSTGNNFGELGLRPQFVSLSMFLASTPPVNDYFPELMAKAEEAAGNTDLAAQIRAGIDDVGENDAPSAANDTYNVNEDQSLTKDAAAGVLKNDSDPDGDMLTASIQGFPSHGSVNLSANGSFVYTPNTNYHGTDSFTYTVSDGSLDSSPATVTITVNSVNDKPQAGADAYPLPSGGGLDIGAAAGVLDNDSDVDGDDLTASLVTTTPNGTLVLDSDGSFTYTPKAGFHGQDTFIYRAYDGTAYSTNTTVTITVNDVPVANPDSYTVDEDGTLTKNAADGVRHNDTDADGDTLTITVVAHPANGTLTPSADGSFVYKPNLNFHGQDSFTYKANDGYANSNTATVTITVNPVNDAPVAHDDYYTAQENVTLNVDAAAGVLVNDSDVEGSDLSPVILDHPDHGSVSLTVTGDGSFSYTPDPGFTGTDTFTYTVSDGELDSDPATVTIIVVAADVPTTIDDEYDVEGGETLTVTVEEGLLANDVNVEDTFDVVVVDDVDHGTLVPADDGSFTYTPTPGFTGTDTFTYKLTDGTDESNVATVTITVTGDLPGNDAPVAGDDEYTVTEDGVLDVNQAEGILHNDYDVDGSPATPLTSLVITEINYNPYDPTDDEKLVDLDFDNNDFEFIELENVGDETIDLTDVRFTQGITFNFTGSDVTELGAGATVLVVRNREAFAARYGTEPTVAGEFSGSLSNEGERIVLVDADGAVIHDFSYDDEDGWPTGADGEDYTLQIKEVSGEYNDPDNWEASAGKGGTPGTGTGQSVDVPDVLLITVVDEPTHGELTDFNTDDGSFVYTPEADFSGVDTFTYRLSDGDQESNLATVTITVQGVNDAPVGQADEYDAVEDQTLEVSAQKGVLANDSDDDGSPASALTSLVITEINYHPYDVTPEEQESDPGLDRDDFEFIELENVGDETIDLTGVEFTQGIAFNFSDGDVTELAPGETVLVVANREAFELRYETGLNVAGEFGSDQLSNNGETIVLVDAAGSTIHEFTYDDAGGWPAAADGAGSTLQIKSASGNYNDPTNWEASQQQGGTPGTGTGQSVEVPAERTAVLVTGPSHAAADAFQLNPDGSFTYTPEENWSGPDEFTYKASDGVLESELITVTIHVVSTNDAPEAVADEYDVDEDETLARNETQGVLWNDFDIDDSPATPLTSLVITEINYNPYNPTDDERAVDSTLQSSDFQFIELENVGHQTIDLTGVQFTEGITFNFTGSDVLQLAPGATVLVVSNPSAFEIRYGDELNVAGEFTGLLSTGGETIRLADDDATIQEFAYDDGGVWPSQADGEGSTLEVLDVEADYNEPTSWKASADDGGTPGIGTGQTVAVPVVFTAVLVAGPSHAAADAFQLNPDGSFTYTPEENWNGPDEFTYKASDGAMESEVTTVKINVKPVNDAPTTGEPETYEVDEDGLLDIGEAEGLLPNDIDVDGTPVTPLTSLRITEIHYNPTADDTYTSQQLEFIELQNIGDETINLAGVQFTQGITFDFSGSAVTQLAPDATVLVVANLTAFEARYDTGLNVAGEFTGNLDDDGAQITLKNAADETILDFTYDDAAPWPTEADGGGKSLEVVGVTGDYNSSANWLPSDDAGGTPGDAPASTVDLDKIVAVPGTDPEHGTLDLRIDGSFTYTPEQDFYGIDKFTYRASDGSAKSDLITVTITVKPINDAPVANGDPYTMPQGATELVVPVGEGVLANDSDVDDTPSTPFNSLVVTEINYNPHAPTTEELAVDSALTNLDFQFIELQNVGDGTIDLSDVYFAQGVDFTFAAGTELDPGETVLVVSNAEKFAIRYPGVANIAGKFTPGELSDDGEMIELKDAADNTIQEFTYDDEGDWPAEADGGGKTLEVLNVIGDYSDPANWQASDDEGGTPGTSTTAAVDHLMALLVDEPEYGTLELNPDGSFTYTPGGSFTGTDSFTYKASDGVDESETVTVTIQEDSTGP